MITTYKTLNGRLEPSVGGDLSDLAAIVWIDLANPDAAEEDRLEAALAVDIPTHEDMQEIEPSSRLYSERGAVYLTAQIIATHDPNETEIAPVTFMLTPDRLITVRYHKPGSFDFFVEWAKVHDMGCSTGQTTLMALIETVVDRLADVIEGEARKLDGLTRAIFAAHRPSGKSSTLSALLQRIGRAEDLNGKVLESLSTLQRLLGYLGTPLTGEAGEILQGLNKGQVETLARDVRYLLEAATTQSHKVRFQLDATLGVINIRQSDIIKIFSVVAFVFLPPTLIASIYGMNFVHMPELKWPWGYPMAIGLMVLSALVPWLVFRAKKLL
ncbi:magnesium transporter CorA family protein [Tabrizicola sp.]|uniref:magnesium transporter CorA family protein n=1 Tax=Tabrizicola sp. TaxID=2005166 RepID=UPI00286C50D8|nr:magnesium transporter CorA family protein [Tabrizicola sp.]